MKKKSAGSLRALPLSPLKLLAIAAFVVSSAALIQSARADEVKWSPSSRQLAGTGIKKQLIPFLHTL